MISFALDIYISRNKSLLQFIASLNLGFVNPVVNSIFVRLGKKMTRELTDPFNGFIIL